MNVEDLRQTTLEPENRTLLRVTLEAPARPPTGWAPSRARTLSPTASSSTSTRWKRDSSVYEKRPDVRGSSRSHAQGAMHSGSRQRVVAPAGCIFPPDRWGRRQPSHGWVTFPARCPHSQATGRALDMMKDERRQASRRAAGRVFPLGRGVSRDIPYLAVRKLFKTVDIRSQADYYRGDVPPESGPVRLPAERVG